MVQRLSFDQIRCTSNIIYTIDLILKDCGFVKQTWRRGKQSSQVF